MEYMEMVFIFMYFRKVPRYFQQAYYVTFSICEPDADISRVPKMIPVNNSLWHCLKLVSQTQEEFSAKF